MRMGKMILAWAVLGDITLPGFRSRCTMLLSWAFASPSAISVASPMERERRHVSPRRASLCWVVRQPASSRRCFRLLMPLAKRNLRILSAEDLPSAPLFLAALVQDGARRPRSMTPGRPGPTG